MAFNHQTYGTPQSDSLDIIRSHGFNPIGISIMICEETFVFATDEEAHRAHSMLEATPEGTKSIVQGFWYGKEDFEREFGDYVTKSYNSDPENAPKVYWL